MVIEEDPIEHRECSSFIIQVVFNVENTWEVSRNYRAFCQLHEKLVNQFPSVQFPQSSQMFAQKSLTDFNRGLGRKSMMLSVPGSGSGGASFLPTSNILNERQTAL
jgi:hypothetical protein